MEAIIIIVSNYFLKICISPIAQIDPGGQEQYIL